MRGPLPGGLIVAQVALTMVLLVAAVVFVQTLDRLRHVPLGFEPDHLLVVTADASRARVEAGSRLAFYERLVDAVSAAPGVTRAVGSMWTPIGAGGGGLMADAGGRRVEGERQVAFNFVTPGWFLAYGTAIHAGRDFEAGDGATAPRVAVINERLARTLFPGRPAIGEPIDAGPCGRGGCTVVGVVANARYGRSLRDDAPPTVYVPLAQSAGLTPPGNASVRLTVRAASDPAVVAPGVAAALAEVDRRLVFSMRPLSSEVDASLAQERLVASLASFFGAVALLLSALGLYGLTAYAVVRRRREIGIRLALGARPRAAATIVVGRVWWHVAAGLAAGSAASAWLSGLVTPLLYGVAPRHPATLAVAALTLLTAATVAAWIPAARAARLDPARVLRDG